MSCTFCDIISGTSPCYKLYEDEQFLAFLDIHPYVEGHTLVIPKKHFRWVWDVPAQSKDSITISRYMEVCQIISDHFRSQPSIHSVYSFIFGNEVPHAHIHLLPTLNQKDFDWLFKDFVSRRKGSLSIDEGKELVQKLQVV